MMFEKIISEGLSHNSYIIGSGTEAAVIDPRRDCEIYVHLAEKYSADITHIFETHRNEDYVIGSLPLSRKVGAEIYHGARFDFKYGNGVKEGDTFHIGTLELTILETPGHTPESISLLLRDREVSDTPYMVFSGDALFAGSVGRTDLVKGRREEMSGKLYESLFTKLLSLGDGVIVLPAHGSGSVCGPHIANHPFTTIGYERRTNPLLQLDQEAFVRTKVTEPQYVPPYFAQMEHLNQVGSPPADGLPYLEPLPIPKVKEYQKRGAQVIDIRSPTAFAGGHIPESINIWREGLTSFMGYVLNYEDPIILIHDCQDLDSVAADFVRMGYDNLSGFLAPGFSTWPKGAQEIETTSAWGVQDLKANLEDPSLFILDVRDIKSREDVGYIPRSRHIYIGNLEEHIQEVPGDRHVVVYCDSGFKGSMGASILQKHGYRQVTNLLGGTTAWMNAHYPMDKD